MVKRETYLGKMAAEFYKNQHDIMYCAENIPDYATNLQEMFRLIQSLGKGEQLKRRARKIADEKITLLKRLKLMKFSEVGCGRRTLQFLTTNGIIETLQQQPQRTSEHQMLETISKVRKGRKCELDDSKLKNLALILASSKMCNPKHAGLGGTPEELRKAVNAFEVDEINRGLKNEA